MHANDVQEYRDRPIRRARLFEVSVFLFLILPSMFLSMSVIRHERVAFDFIAISLILRDIGLVALIGYFVWRNREPLDSIGWAFSRPGRELGLGLVLYPAIAAGAVLIQAFMTAIGFTQPSIPVPTFLESRTVSQTVLAIILVSVVAIAEETIFRGYLISRLRTVLGNTAGAVILSCIIFSLGHAYEGSAGLITVGFLGAALAVIYLWRRNLMAPITIHFVHDFIGIVLIPYLSGPA